MRSKKLSFLTLDISPNGYLGQSITDRHVATGARCSKGFDGVSYARHDCCKYCLSRGDLVLKITLQTLLHVLYNLGISATNYAFETCSKLPCHLRHLVGILCWQVGPEPASRHLKANSEVAGTSTVASLAQVHGVVLYIGAN